MRLLEWFLTMTPSRHGSEEYRRHLDSWRMSMSPLLLISLQTLAISSRASDDLRGTLSRLAQWQFLPRSIYQKPILALGSKNPFDHFRFGLFLLV